MIDVLVVGVGEYVTGVSRNAPANSDKSFGVIALSLFDMRKRGMVSRILLAGRNAEAFEVIREHFQNNLSRVYPSLDVGFESFPKSGLNNTAYRDALKEIKAGSCVMIFTPDDTHFAIAKEALEAKMHVLVAKPMVKTVAEHLELQTIAKQNGVLLMLEVHKRFDPLYADAVDRMRTFGDFSLMHSYMSQPKSQLDTFASWAGISSDISYYLNTHHIDILCWAIQEFATPLSVYAIASNGVANQKLSRKVEDTITLTIQWQNHSGTLGTSVHTASWIAPPSDVHSQQRFFYMGHFGEIMIDQAHRGYTIATDTNGYKSVNPLFMKYTPRDGEFIGQESYGYQSIANFVESASKSQWNHRLPTIENTLNLTKILEAGRMSLDQNRIVMLSEMEKE